MIAEEATVGKRGFRKIPPQITTAIAALSSDTFYIGVTRRYSMADIAAGALSHLGIGVTGSGTVAAPSSLLPDPQRGRWSRWNVQGRIVVRKDLPKVDKEYGWDSPNFGDWSKGSHWVSQTRQVYQRETIYGLSLPILVDVGTADPSGVTIGFRVDRVFDRATGYEDVDLVFALSLLQENVGSVGVVATATSVASWLAAQHVPWEFLPPGTAFATVINRLGLSRTSAATHALQDRFVEIMKFGPGDIVISASGFARYIGFKFRDDLVAFENAEYGNALYLMYDDWRLLSQRSRVDLLRQGGKGYDRIVHKPGWESTLRIRLAAAGWTPPP